jgi:hypothetical protein
LKSFVLVNKRRTRKLKVVVRFVVHEGVLLSQMSSSLPWTVHHDSVTLELKCSNFFELYGQVGHNSEQPVGPNSVSPVYRSSCPMWAAKCQRVGVTAMANDSVVDLGRKEEKQRTVRIIDLYSLCM